MSSARNYCAAEEKESVERLVSGGILILVRTTQKNAKKGAECEENRLQATAQLDKEEPKQSSVKDKVGKE